MAKQRQEVADQRVETQTSRRLKYGLNVVVAAAAAVALVILINWIAYRQYVRFDLTATRQYSLSDQTRQVLRNLDEDYRVVTLFRATSPQLERVRDLIDEYGRFAGNIAVEHIDPDLDFARRNTFFERLRERYTEDLAPVTAAIGEARGAMAELTGEMATLAEPVQAAAEHPELTDEGLKQFLGQLQTALTRTAEQIETRQAQVDPMLEEPLPDYGTIARELQSLFTQLDGNLFAIAVDRLDQAVTRTDIPSAVTDRLIGINGRFKTLRERARAAREKLNGVESAEKYNELVSQLAGRESVIVLGPDQVRVLDVLEMFRRPTEEEAAAAGGAEVRFLGEERLTGALVSLSETPALVVFVVSGQTTAVGPRGQYQQVAERLRAANFDVEQWNPQGQFSPMGGQLPPSDPPAPRPGQKRIWVVLPFPPLNPMNPQAATVKPAAAESIEEGLDAGDSAIFMFSFDPSTQFGAEDPIVELARRWQLTPQTDRVVMRQVQQPDRRARATSQFEVSEWPDELSITRALGGMPGLFVASVPVVAGQAEGVTTHPLVVVDAETTWAERDAAMMASPADAEPSPEELADSFVIGAAAVRGDQRVIVMGDPVWASDAITTYGALGPGTAEIMGAIAPANSELFVNSIYWLAGLDQLIAASPRTQDIRRIESIGGEAVAAVRWGLLAGLPLAIIACGMGVWLVRRSG